MNLFNKVINWATDSLNSYNNENELYEEILKKIGSIESILESDYYLEETNKYTFSYNDSKVNVSGLLNYLEIMKRRLEDINSINKAQIQLQEMKKKVKNLIVYNNDIPEINAIIIEINRLIYLKPLCYAFKDLDIQHIMEKRWTYDELINLKEQISIRKCEIIPEMEKYKR